MEDNIFAILANSSKRIEILNLKPEQVYQNDGDLPHTNSEVLYGGTEQSTIDACFLSFDNDKNESLSFDEFYCLVEQLFRDKDDNVPMMANSKVKTIFEIFDKSGDAMINKDEFIYCWKSWVKKVIYIKVSYK